MYDDKFANERRRAPVAPERRGCCVSTDSEYEWPCLILKDWICETHCTEVQLRSYEDTRKVVAERKLIGKRTLELS